MDRSKENIESKNRFDRATIAANIIRRMHSDEIYKIILFGSVSRDQAKADSDIDMAIITNVKTEWNDLNLLDELVNFSQELPLKYVAQLNLYVTDSADFENRKHSYDFYHNIEKDGIIL